jgi:hypothetical protein
MFVLMFGQRCGSMGCEKEGFECEQVQPIH